MDDFLIIFRILENNDVPHPSLSAAVRFHGKAVPIPENRFHAPAGIGDGLNRIAFHSFESDAQFQTLPNSCTKTLGHLRKTLMQADGKITHRIFQTPTDGYLM